MISQQDKLKRAIINSSALGSIFSISATSLRFTDDIGYGECLILISIILFLFNFKLIQKSKSSSRIPKMLIYSFCALNFLGFCYATFFLPIGATINYYNGVLRTALAYSFAIINATVVLAVVVDKDDLFFVIKRLILFFNLINIISFILLFPNLLQSLTTGFRFAGFSKNPNQLGTAASIIPFFAIFLYKKGEIKLPNLIFTLLVTALLARTIKSDALFYAFLGSGFLFAILVLKKFNIYQRALIAISYSLLFYFFILNTLEVYITNTDNDADQASVRFTLWKNAVTATESSPLAGLGPGFFSGLTGPFQGAESHNTFIDYLSNAGLIGLTCYLVFLCRTTLKLYLIKEYNLIVAFSAIVAFSSFHNVLRHPIFWLVLLLLHGYTVVYNKNASKC